MEVGFGSKIMKVSGARVMVIVMRSLIPSLSRSIVISNGVGSRSGFNQKFRGGMHSNGVGLEDLGGSSSGKGADDPIEAMASSIEFLGEVFVKMEKRKMEMAGEMAKMRMKMEMKQNQLIMESQKQMVDACVKALWETKKKKMKVVSLDES